MVPDDQGDEEHIANGQTEQFAVAYDVHRMLVMASRIDKSPDLVQQRGEIENQFHALIELMFLHQVREKLSRQRRNVPSMRFVKRQFATQVDCRPNDLISKLSSPSVSDRQIA